MTDYPQRLRYFDGQFLDQDDFTTEQTYHLNRRLLHNKLLHSPGIINGLKVQKNDSSKIKVTTGEALDSLGREISLENEEIMTVSNSSKTLVCVWIEYSEEKLNKQDILESNVDTSTRVEEKATVKVGSSFPDMSKYSYVMLAKFKLDDNGNIPGVIDGYLDQFNVEPVRVLSGDRSVSVSKLKTELLKKDTITFNDTTNPISEKRIEVQRSSWNESTSTESGHLLVFTDVNEFDKDCSFKWEIQCGAVQDKNTKEKFRTQTVIFNATSRERFIISYSVYTLLR